jgi:glycosyltransferase involved in cell wall biosynthesis
VAKTSVIIPTYNRSAVVREAIFSVLAQTDPDVEVLVIDDGSTDDTRAAVEEFRDGRVRYFYKTNGGPASARNFGLSKAGGEYIAFLDSDDLWPANYLEVMISRLETNGKFGAAYSPITVQYPDGRKLESYKRPGGKSGSIALDLFRHGFVWTSGAVFRGSVWKDFYFDEILDKTSEDSDAFLRLSVRTAFLFVPDVEACHRISADSISAEVGIACARLLVLERFYFKLGGDAIIPPRVAMRRLSHACRKVAEDRRRSRARVAAVKLYKRAVAYWPYDLRLYPSLLRALLLRKNEDPEPDWLVPQPLGEPVARDRFG